MVWLRCFAVCIPNAAFLHMQTNPQTIYQVIFFAIVSTVPKLVREQWSFIQVA